MEPIPDITPVQGISPGYVPDQSTTQSGGGSGGGGVRARGGGGGSGKRIKQRPMNDYRRIHCMGSRLKL